MYAQLIQALNTKNSSGGTDWVKVGFIGVVCLVIVYVISIVLKPFTSLFSGLKDGYESVFKGLGITETKQEKAIEENYDTSVKEQIENARATENSTKSKAEWAIIAEQIHRDLGYSGDDNEDDAGYQVCRVKNTVDFWELHVAFGTRKNYTMGIPTGSYDLPSFIRSELSEDKVSKINENYRSKGIKFQY